MVGEGGRQICKLKNTKLDIIYYIFIIELK